MKISVPTPLKIKDKGFSDLNQKKNPAKTTKNTFLACFRAYVGQPHDHIGSATSMPFCIL